MLERSGERDDIRHLPPQLFQFFRPVQKQFMGKCACIGQFGVKVQKLAALHHFLRHAGFQAKLLLDAIQAVDVESDDGDQAIRSMIMRGVKPMDIAKIEDGRLKQR